MTAYVKIKGIERPQPVYDISLIKAHTDSDVLEIRDFRDVQFYHDCYYSFIGRTILHVYGSMIEYLYFDSSQ